jgi:hypothetical protein
MSCSDMLQNNVYALSVSVVTATDISFHSRCFQPQTITGLVTLRSKCPVLDGRWDEVINAPCVLSTLVQQIIIYLFTFLVYKGGNNTEIYNIIYIITIGTYRTRWQPKYAYKIKHLAEILRETATSSMASWSWLHLQSLAPTNPHWARIAGYGLFSLCVIYKKSLCPNSEDINRLMMMRNTVSFKNK